MYTNIISSGIAKKIKKLFPNVKIEVDAVASKAFGKIFVMVIESNQRNLLGNIKELNLTFDISYVCKESGNPEYNDWLKTMYSAFEVVETEESSYRTKNRRGQKAEGIYHFIFDVAARYIVTDDTTKMATLKQKGADKNGR